MLRLIAKVDPCERYPKGFSDCIAEYSSEEGASKAIADIRKDPGLQNLFDEFKDAMLWTEAVCQCGRKAYLDTTRQSGGKEAYHCPRCESTIYNCECEDSDD